MCRQACEWIQHANVGSLVLGVCVGAGNTRKIMELFLERNSWLGEFRVM